MNYNNFLSPFFCISCIDIDLHIRVVLPRCLSSRFGLGLDFGSRVCSCRNCCLSSVRVCGVWLFKPSTKRGLLVPSGSALTFEICQGKNLSCKWRVIVEKAFKLTKWSIRSLRRRITSRFAPRNRDRTESGWNAVLKKLEAWTMNITIK